STTTCAARPPCSPTTISSGTWGSPSSASCRCCSSSKDRTPGKPREVPVPGHSDHIQKSGDRCYGTPPSPYHSLLCQNEGPTPSPVLNVGSAAESTNST